MNYQCVGVFDMPNPCWYHILWNSLVDSAIFKTSFQNSGLKWLVFKSGGHLALADGGVLLCCYRVKEGRCTCPSEVKKAIWYVQLHQLIYEKKIVWLFSTVCFQKCPSMLPSKIKDWVEIPWEQLGTDSNAINPCCAVHFLVIMFQNSSSSQIKLLS